MNIGGSMIFDVTLKDYLKEIDESPLLTAREEQELGRLIVNENDFLARDRLVRSNLRLVVNIAKKYSNRGMGLGDLIEEGNLGLIKAVDYFDPERGNRFSTYAAWWIKQSIQRSLLENGQPVHIPTYMMTLINQWRHFSSDLENRLGRVPTIDEIAKEMKLPIKKANAIFQIVGVLNTVSDTSSEDYDDDEKIESTLRDENMEMPGDELALSEEKTKMIRMLDEIEPREALVLKLHYGLDGVKPMTLKEIGEKLQLTRERIRQIQREALTKLFQFMTSE